MKDDFLYKFRQPPRPEFAADLYQRISQPMKTSSRTRLLRTAALAFSIVAVIAAVLFFSPSTRAVAQSIIRQFGGYIFVEGTPQPDPTKKEMAEKGVSVSPEQEATLQAEKQQMKDQPQVKENSPDTAAKQVSSLALDAAAASQLTGFTVLAPAYVPAGYTPEDMKNGSGGWSVAHENGGVAAITSYQNQAGKSFLAIEETRYEQGQARTVERPQIVDVTVRGQSGAWMPDLGGKSTLAWDENGITYLVVSNSLSLDELLKVAESLGK